MSFLLAAGKIVKHKPFKDRNQLSNVVYSVLISAHFFTHVIEELFWKVDDGINKRVRSVPESLEFNDAKVRQLNLEYSVRKGSCFKLERYKYIIAAIVKFEVKWC